MDDSLLTIGITTFNRRAVLEAAAHSLAQADGLEHARVWVLDDASDEYDAQHLQRLFPQAEVIRAATRSGGADQAMHRLFQRFVAQGSGYLFVMDADLLASRRLVDACLHAIASAGRLGRPGLFSLFNTASHPACGQDGGYLLKRTVGAAGTLWEKGLLDQMLRNVPLSGKFDWDWSAWLSRNAIPIRVTPRSYVQHIGRIGQHSRSFSSMDHGERFDGYEGDNLGDFIDHTRAGLLRMIADQQLRLDGQAKAIEQITRVVQSQAQIINELIGTVTATAG